MTLPSGGLRASAIGAVLAVALALPAAPAHAQSTPISPFAWRGIVEGAYGPSWNHTQRVRMLQWMALHGFNAYVHAPKNDRYESIDWRTPYPSDIQATFNSEIALAQSAGIQWIPNISPARPDVNSPTRLCFSCADDVTAAVTKLQPFLAAGVHTVMVSWDDVQEQLGRTEDQVAYGGSGPLAFGKATADWMNRLLPALQQVDPSVQVLMVPTDYAGTADTPYLKGLREGRLRPEIQILWTGPSVRAADFTPQDVSAYASLVGRTPMVWENWVNDDFTPGRLFLGPYRRTHDLSGVVAGFFFNPMNLADLNMLPLATAADWMRDPTHYDPHASWLNAVNAMAGEDAQLAAELRAFAETSVSSTLSPSEAPTFSARVNDFLAAYRAGGSWPVAQGRLDDELALTERAAGDLVRLPDPYFSAQAAPYLAAAQQNAGAARVAVMLLAAERPHLGSYPTTKGIAGVVKPPDANQAAALRAIFTARRGAVQSTFYMYGCRTAALGCPPNPDNALDDFLSAVASEDSSFAGQLPAATGSVRLLLGSRPVRIDPTTGAFRLPASGCGRSLTAIDGAGGQVTLPTPSCARLRALGRAKRTKRRVSARGRAAACRECAARRGRRAPAPRR